MCPFVGRLLLAGLFMVAAGRAGAQVVRGTVRDAGSGLPIAGAVVSLYAEGSVPASGASGGRAMVETLSGAEGRFAASPAGSGRFVLVVKRIGARRFVSAPFDLAAGATVEIEPRLEAVAWSLPEVTVSSATPCRTRGDERERVARLWEEARAALVATAVTREEQRVVATVMRYRRVLSASTLAVRSDAEAVDRRQAARPFAAVDPESLDTQGYIRRGVDGMLQYFAPDDALLLSEPFLRSHCFGVARTTGGDSVGLTFEPVRGRSVSDIRGVMWLDAASFQLRRLNFRYTRLPLPVEDERIGGEVLFERMPSGAWLITRWFLRVPHVEMKLLTIGTENGIRPQPVITAFAETGGWAVVDAGGGARAVGSVVGRVVDSSGVTPLVGARVVAVGTGAVAQAGVDGTFRFDSLPLGTHALVVSHPSYARLGLTVARESVESRATASGVAMLRAPNAKEVARRWCGDEAADSLVAARFILPLTLGTDSLPTRSLRIAWEARTRLGDGFVRKNQRVVERPVDPAGGVTVCAVQPGGEVLVEERDEEGRTRYRSTYAMPWTGWQLFELTRVCWATPR